MAVSLPWAFQIQSGNFQHYVHCPIDEGRRKGNQRGLALPHALKTDWLLAAHMVFMERADSARSDLHGGVNSLFCWTA